VVDLRPHGHVDGLPRRLRLDRVDALCPPHPGGARHCHPRRGVRRLRRASGPRQVRDLDVVSALASIATPFFLGACLGGIASGRVPYGNAKGDLVTSWLKPTSAIAGALAIAVSAYLAAVYLSDDARRHGEHDLAEPYRRRALAAGTAAGLLAFAGLGVLHADAHPLYQELVAGRGLPAVIASGAAGLAALTLVLRRRFES
jgi:cytochrome d ubiquinol oxidase subunit II